METKSLFLPLGKLCNTHPIVLPNTMKKIGRRIEKLKSMKGEKSNRPSKRISFELYYLVEVLAVELTDPDEQAEFNSLVDTLLATANFDGFNIFCN
jgi:hypothetical protein